METPIEKFEMWARVDLMGHNQRVGKLSVTNTGVEMLYRLDIPQPDGTFTTEFYGKGATYSILPVSEDAARLIAVKLGPPQPVYQWDLPEQWREAIRTANAKALPAATPGEDEETQRRAQDGQDDDDERDI